MKGKLEIMDKSLISVIMANYNTPVQYLKEAIDSILTQTYTEFELIIVDDGSTNESVDYIESLNDDRIIFLKNELNLGQPKTRNRAIDVARGEYIAIMDSDDISLPTRFEKQISFMEKNPDVIVCGTWFEKFGIESKVRKPLIDDFELYRCQLIFDNTPITLCHPSAMMRKSMLDKFNIRYDESFLKSQDYRLWTICSRFGRMAIIDEVLIKYRTHAKQISVNSFDAQMNCVDGISRLQLCELGVGCVDEFSRWRRCLVSSVNDYIKYFNWLESVKSANRKTNLYRQVSLDTYVELMQYRGLKRLGKKKVISLFFKTDNNQRKFIVRSAFKKPKK